MDLLCTNSQNSDNFHALSRDTVAMTISKCLHVYGDSDHEWTWNAIYNSLKMEVDIRRQRRILRIPVTIMEPGFISELSSGASLRALIIFSFLSYMNLIVENALDAIISGKELLQKS